MIPDEFSRSEDSAEISETLVAFNEQMEAVLKLLDYGNLARIWPEYRHVEASDEATFDLHVTRQTDDEFILGNWLVSTLLAISKQLIDVPRYLTKSLIVLLWETRSEVLWK